MDARTTADYRTLDQLIATGSVLPNELRLKAPVPGSDVNLQSLEFQRRTVTALTKSGLYRCPERISDLSIGDLLRLPGFGVKCLQDYLSVVLPVVRQHSVVKRKIKPVSAHRALLNDVESPLEVNMRLPDVPPGYHIETLDLKPRTLHCLRKLKIGVECRLSDFTVRDLLNARGFGHVSVADLLEKLGRAVAATSGYESLGMPKGRGLAEIAVCIEEILRGRVFSAQDLRFGAFLRALRCKSSTHLIEMLHSSESDLAQKNTIALQLLNAMQHATSLTLEKEAFAIRQIQDSRDESLVRAYYGFGDLTIARLEDVGRQFGITRQRVNQICVPTRLRKHATCTFMPVLDTVISVIQEHIPADAKSIELRLLDLGLVEVNTEIGEILRYCSSLGLGTGIIESGSGTNRIVMGKITYDAAQRLVSAARRLAALHGTVTLGRALATLDSKEAVHLSEEASNLALRHDPKLEPVGSNPTWFVRRDGLDSRFRRRLLELLAFAGELPLVEFRRALKRHRRRSFLVPPSYVLRKVLEKVELIEVSDDTVRLRPGSVVDWAERDTNETRIVKILRREKGVCDRRRLQDLSAHAGIGAPSFWSVLVNSPFITPLGKSVYGLIGVRPPPGVVEDLFARRRAIRGGVIDRGWTTDRKLWILLKLSSSAFETGIVSIPAPMRKLLGASYEIIVDGSTADTRVTLGKSSAWGFRRVIEEVGAEAGDCMLLVFDLQHEQVELKIGGEDLADELTESDSSES